jgi:hypothetical protein|tara:strand:+ start:1713 stop:2096 length:384 start_codon:yes stop_codon:yes gene_type:complete
MSIDDATPEDWNNLRVKGSDQHPLFPIEDEPVVAEAAMTKSYKFKTIDDEVNSPAHYKNQGDIECIDAMESMLSREEIIGYLRGNSFKYRWRCRNKGSAVTDLKKAEWYERRLLDLLKGEDNGRQLG